MKPILKTHTTILYNTDGTVDEVALEYAARAEDHRRVVDGVSRCYRTVRILETLVNEEIDERDADLPAAVELGS